MNLHKRSYIWLVFLFCFLWSGIEEVNAHKKEFRVMLIRSYDHRLPLLDGKDLVESLEDEGVDVKLYVEDLNAHSLAWNDEKVRMFHICNEAQSNRVDLIVTVGDEAFYTLATCGDSLGYRLPVVVGGIKFPDRKLLESMPNVCGFTVEPGYCGMLEEAHRLFPERKEVICLVGTSTLSQKGMDLFIEQWDRFHRNHPQYGYKRLNVQKNDLRDFVTQICDEKNSKHCIVVTPIWTTLTAFVGRNSKAPLFACQNVALTRGAFGSYDMTQEQTAKQLGEIAAKVLKGASPASIGVTNRDCEMQYDYKQLKFFNVDPERVGGYNEVVNIPFYERYFGWIIGFYVFSLMALVALVFWLWNNRKEIRRRLQAQNSLKTQLQLIAQRDEYNNLLCSLHEGVMTFDLDLRIRFVNIPLLRMLHLSATERDTMAYAGQTAGYICGIFSGGEHILYSMLREVHKTCEPIPLPEDCMMRDRNGRSNFAISGKVVPIFVQNELIGMALVFRNISEEELLK